MIARALSAGLPRRAARSEATPRQDFSALRQPGRARRRRLVATAARLAAGLRWSEPGRRGRALADLDDHLLRDIGLL